MSFGAILQQLRKEKGFSQEELAKKMGVTRSSITNYETDRNFPTADGLDKLTHIFDCSLDFLMGKGNRKIPVLSASDYELLDSIHSLEKEDKKVAITFIQDLLKKQK